MDLGELQVATFARATEATARAYPPERRLSATALEAYLDRRVFGVLSTTRPNGRPHAALISYVRRDLAFWMPTVAGSVRASNLRGVPWGVLSVAEGDRDEHVAVVIEGPVEQVPIDGAPPEVAATASGEWVDAWLRLDAQRLLSYAAPGATS